MGFKDGTDNIKAEDTATLGDYVWAKAADGQAWMDGGCYLVSRRIRMLIEPWDSTPLQEQERVIGRQKGSGAPPGLQDEFDPIDFTSKGPSGGPLVDEHAHVRLAHPQQNGGSKILRRGYSLRRRHRRVGAARTPGCSSLPTNGTRAPASSASTST